MNYFNKKYYDNSFCINCKCNQSIKQNKDRLESLHNDIKKSSENKKNIIKINEKNKEYFVNFLQCNKLTKYSLKLNNKLKPKVSLNHPYIGSYGEIIALFRAKILNGEHFSLARYGDGELAVINKYYYNSIDSWKSPSYTDLNINKQEYDKITDRIAHLVKDPFLIAEKYKEMYLGLPLYFCKEGIDMGITRGGGGNYKWLKQYKPFLKNKNISSNNFTYSWVWGNLNYIKED